MTPHPDLTDAQRTEMVKWILSQTASAIPSGQIEAKAYSYTLKDGTNGQPELSCSFWKARLPK